MSFTLLWLFLFAFCWFFLWLFYGKESKKTRAMLLHIALAFQNWKGPVSLFFFIFFRLLRAEKFCPFGIKLVQPKHNCQVAIKFILNRQTFSSCLFSFFSPFSCRFQSRKVHTITRPSPVRPSTSC